MVILRHLYAIFSVCWLFKVIFLASKPRLSDLLAYHLVSRVSLDSVTEPWIHVLVDFESYDVVESIGIFQGSVLMDCPIHFRIS